MVVPVKACNFINIRLSRECFFVNFLKPFGTYFDALLEFSKSLHKNTGEKIIAKYLSAGGWSVKTNTINCDDKDNAICFLIY